MSDVATSALVNTHRLQATIMSSACTTAGEATDAREYTGSSTEAWWRIWGKRHPNSAITRADSSTTASARTELATTSLPRYTPSPTQVVGAVQQRNTLHLAHMSNPTKREPLSHDNTRRLTAPALVTPPGLCCHVLSSCDRARSLRDPATDRDAGETPSMRSVPASIRINTPTECVSRQSDKARTLRCGARRRAA